MIRVGFPSPVPTPGKFNYYRSVIMSILAAPNRQIEPVLLLKFDEPEPKDFPKLPVVRTRLVDPTSRSYKLRRMIADTTGHDLAMEWLCRKHDLKALSHFVLEHHMAGTKTLSWIYDFQHNHLPAYFSAEDLAFRDKFFSDQCKFADTVIVSSNDAAGDMQKFFPQGVKKTRVLQFVGAPNVAPPAPLDHLVKTYNIPRKFFALPNQFWVHKNHRAVINAMVMLRERGEKVHVVATGSSREPRNPAFYDDLMAEIASLGLNDQFQVLGLIPYPDVLSLLHHSVAILNPSYFEGWSTSVEESKSLGKRIILSSLPVHIEQAPKRGTFFDPDDHKALAELMSQAWNSHDPAEDAREAELAVNQIPDRLAKCGAVYQNMVLELVK